MGGRTGCYNGKNEAYSKILPVAAFTKLLRADFKARLLSKANLPVVRVIFISHHIFIECRDFPLHHPEGKGKLPSSLCSRKGGVTHLVGKFLPVRISLISAKS